MAVALVSLFTVTGYSQIYFGTSHEYTKARIFKKVNDNYHNNIIFKNPEAGYRQCLIDHNTILDIVRNKHKEHIARLLSKVNELSKNKEYDGFARAKINSEITKRVVHYMILSEMKKELARKKIKGKVFEMKYTNVNVERYFDEALDAAAKYRLNRTVPVWLITEVKSKLLSEMRNQIVKNSVRVIVNGVAIEFGKKLLAKQVTTEAFKSALRSSAVKFSSTVLVSAGRGFLIDVATSFLKGNRLPPETLWLELLDEYPGIIVNPELMHKAGINDGAWTTHCSTINRRAYSLERRIEKLKISLDKELGEAMRMIDKFSSTHDLRSHPRAVIDNTYVAPPRRIR